MRYFWGMKMRLLCTFLVLFQSVLGQNNDFKTVDDFDLNGWVKSCEIQTAYGSELLHFNRDNSLQKIVTVFNELDREQITFTYKDKALSEKIIEVFRENVLRKELSFYHKFSRNDRIHDELIFSLEGTLVARNQIEVDSLGNTLKRVSESPEQQTIQLVEKRTSSVADSIFTFSDDRLTALEVFKRNPSTQKVNEQLEISYTDSVVTRKVYTFFDQHSLPIRVVDSMYDSQTADFVSAQARRYSYTNKRLTASVETAGNQSQKKTYIYQLDNSDPPNWVKRIEQPSNQYITRRIIYYSENDSIAK